jgi:peptidoglycan-N-acetylglucosamine deacetylase
MRPRQLPPPAAPPASGAVPGQRRQPAFRGRLSRRTLFTAGGLAVIGAAASEVTGCASSAPGEPAPSDLASSGTPGKPPPDVANPLVADPAQVQTQPEYYVHAGPKVIALTIDDGPHPVYTPQILAVLQRYRITATFHMIGRQVAANRALVREVAAAGHVVANHTWDHTNQSKLSLPAIRSEIQRTNDALHAAGITPSVFRAPYGAWSRTVFEACAQARLRPVDWSLDPRDWSRPGAQSIIHRIMGATRTGSIILEHDGGGDRSQTVAALKVVLPELLTAGYRFTTV